MTPVHSQNNSSVRSLGSGSRGVARVIQRLLERSLLVRYAPSARGGPPAVSAHSLLFHAYAHCTVGAYLLGELSHYSLLLHAVESVTRSLPLVHRVPDEAMRCSMIVSLSSCAPTLPVPRARISARKCTDSPRTRLSLARNAATLHKPQARAGVLRTAREAGGRTCGPILLMKPRRERHLSLL